LDLCGCPRRWARGARRCPFGARICATTGESAGRTDGRRRRTTTTVEMVTIEEATTPTRADAGDAARGNEERNEKTAATKATTTTTAAAVTKAASGSSAGGDAKPTPPTISPKMFISPVLLMGGKRLGIDYKDPTHVMKIRMCFVVATTALALAFAFLWVRIVGKKKKLEEDTCEVKVKDDKTGETKTEKISLYEHDVREFRKVLTSNIMGGIMVTVLHFSFKVVPPLLLQSIMMPLNLWDGNLVQVHVLGRGEKDDAKFKRPWEEPVQKSPFAAFAEAMSPDAKGKPGQRKSIDAQRAKKDPKKNPKHKK